MKRAMIVPPDVAGAALAELKQWLAISTPREDEDLTALLRAALDTCEAFTGLMPLEAACEEVLPAVSDWQGIVASPVIAITGIVALAIDGTRTALPVDSYLIDITADGCGRVRLTRPIPQTRIAAAFHAGLAADWQGLPEGLRHGVIRLAAHQYRERDAGDAGQSPPRAVSAFWQPWRRMRLT